ncbi:RHS repeat-associated core domain-containing protein [Persicobacter diffluens]|uniref:RHS repeat-associated core domain-containing protein n=1 Tax=Persicobacter diffluens TaxID=981 RepID=A0AAN4W3L5_9BACT|nr:hypothetical protein PEDI_42140 [Persicobacter diffluens]
MQILDYVYTIDGRLKAINNPHFVEDKKEFAMQLDYYHNDAKGTEFVFTKGVESHYDGQIAASLWRNGEEQDCEGCDLPYEIDLEMNEAPEEGGEFVAMNSITLGEGFHFKAEEGKTFSARIYQNGKSKTQAVIPALTSGYRYAYDEQGQLKEATFGYVKQDYFLDQGNDWKVTDLDYDENMNIQQLSRYDEKGNMLSDTIKTKGQSDFIYKHRLVYEYDEEHPNQLVKVLADGKTYAEYEYDAIGQLTQMNNGGRVTKLSYNTAGLVTEIKDGADHVLFRYYYNTLGHRSKKVSYHPNMRNEEEEANVTYYTRDASGKVLAIYAKNNLLSEAALFADKATAALELVEIPLYGANRLGTQYVETLADGSILRDNQYELKDHLGNVRSVVKRSNNDKGLIALGYSDYYPFGLRQNRYINANYRYGYQGDFAEDETEESGYNVFEARLYDPVIGRWISVDPARQFASGYVGMGNNPVNGVDPDGRDWYWFDDGKMVAHLRTDDDFDIKVSKFSEVNYGAFGKEPAFIAVSTHPKHLPLASGRADFAPGVQFALGAPFSGLARKGIGLLLTKETAITLSADFACQMIFSGGDAYEAMMNINLASAIPGSYQSKLGKLGYGWIIGSFVTVSGNSMLDSDTEIIQFNANSFTKLAVGGAFTLIPANLKPTNIGKIEETVFDGGSSIVNGLINGVIDNEIKSE